MKLYEKLLTIQQKINGLGRDSSGNGFKYVSGDKVLSVVKPLMNTLGLLLKQEVVSIVNTRQDYMVGSPPRNKSEMHSEVMMKFTWIDCETGDKDENSFGSNGQNGWDKGLGSALTYGERYFILKYFHIATDEDDIDNPERKPQEDAAPVAKVKPPFDENNPSFNLAKKMILEGTKTIEDIQKKYTLTQYIIDKLITK